jgi:hypothetical protein
MRHNRAIKKIINRLGGYRPFLDKDKTNDEGDDNSQDGDSDNKVDDTDEQG